MTSYEKHLVRRQAHRHVSVKGKCCEKCGATENLERHHPDYSKPLEVVILCAPCHYAEHPQPRPHELRDSILADAYESFRGGGMRRCDLDRLCQINGVDFSRLNYIWRLSRGLVGATKRKESAA